MIQKYVIITLIYLLSFSLWAQTSNQGVLGILEGTQISIGGHLTNTAGAQLVNDGQLTLLGNLTNDGGFSFGDPILNGQLRLVGTQPQNINGDGLIEANHIEFDNSSAQAFILNADLNIENRATFAQGIINNAESDRVVVFGTHASHNQASDNSYINGPVTKMGDTAFEFPLGHNTKYRSIAIEAPGGASDSYLAQYFPYNSDTEYPHTQKAGNIELIDTQEYWRVTRMQDDDFVRISIGWDTSLTSDELLQNPDLIHIVRWDTDQALWIDEGGVVDTVNNRVTTLLPISGSGIFTLARVKGDLILPGNVTVFNYISPNDNGENDFFLIKGIAQHPNNQLTIYNRWGNQVYQVQGYNESDRVFRGFSNGDFTLSKGDGLPTGTYFYVLEYEYVTNSTPQSYRTAGYLYIN